MSVGDRPVLCLCRGLTRAGVLLAVKAGASGVAEVRKFCEANGHVVAPAPNAAHDCCTGELAGLLRASTAKGQ
ncbi:hypothetical protein [Humidesulfovibrio sp.]